ncbi:MAG: xylose isomerase [Nitrospiraceae bacterium]|nr:MAG: xylose isomerase [Nitrospiraceae bacterium]
MSAHLDRLSLNQITIEQWSLPEFLEGCATAGVRYVGLWRHKVEDVGVTRAARLVQECELRVSSLCRGGFFTERDFSHSENRRALEEAAELGSPVLVLVCGPPKSQDLGEARARIAAGLELLAPHAVELGVRLAIEPMHPMMIASRSAIVTLGEALTLARRFAPSEVGVVVDSYHVFWDPQLSRHLASASRLIASLHVSDWVTPEDDILASRVLPGDGIIDFPKLISMVDSAGYDGPVEVEVINLKLRALPAQVLLEKVIESYQRHIGAEVDQKTTST